MVKETGSPVKKKKGTKHALKNAHSSDEIAEIEPGLDESGSIHGWAYIASANFTPSAWGTLSGSSFSPVLNVWDVLLYLNGCN